MGPCSTVQPTSPASVPYIAMRHARASPGSIEQPWSSRGCAIISWIRLNITGMGVSCILMLTAFYIDRGTRLTLWIPQIAFWCYLLSSEYHSLSILC